MTKRGWVLFACLCVLWGIPYLLIKVAVRELTPASLVFLRTALGAALLLPVAWARGELAPLAARWRAVVAFAVAELAIPWVLLADAERRITSSLAGLLIAAVPLFGVLVSAVSGGGERAGGRRGLGLAAGFAGVILLLGFDPTGADVVSVGEMVLVVLGYAVGPAIAARRLAHLPSSGVVAASLGLCAVGYAPVGLWQLPRHLPGADVLASVALLGVLCTAAAFLVFFALIREAGPVGATVVAYVNPAVAVALGVALLGEPLTPAIGAGFALILGGSFLASGPRARLTAKLG